MLQRRGGSWLCSRLTPRSIVPTHNASSASTARLDTLVSNGPPRSCGTGSIRAPSKRTSPSKVPNHRKPFAVCATALTELCGSPSSPVQEW
jgi:hypothetical protein